MRSRAALNAAAENLLQMFDESDQGRRSQAVAFGNLGGSREKVYANDVQQRRDRVIAICADTVALPVEGIDDVTRAVAQIKGVCGPPVARHQGKDGSRARGVAPRAHGCSQRQAR